MPHITKNKALSLGYPTNNIQTILIDNKMFTLGEAYDWLIHHDFKTDRVRATKNYIRFLQHNPVNGAEYYSKKIIPGIIFIFQQF